MPDASEWARAADARRRIGHSVEYHAEIGSTNDRARELLNEPHGEGRAVVADLQTAGRGRRGRRWESPTGVNLMVSVAFRPHVAASDAAFVSLAVALATRDACARAAGVPLAVRWPNDIVDESGRKVAGILVESSLEEERLTSVVAGIGINVNWPLAEMDREIAARATSLLDLAARPIDRISLLGMLLEALDTEIAAVNAGTSPVPRLREVSALTGRYVNVDLGPAHLSGEVAGIADDGGLRLRTESEEVVLASGEVVSVRESQSEGMAVSS